MGCNTGSSCCISYLECASSIKLELLGHPSCAIRHMPCFNLQDVEPSSGTFKHRGSISGMDKGQFKGTRPGKTEGDMLGSSSKAASQGLRYNEPSLCSAASGAARIRKKGCLVALHPQ